MRRNQCPLPNAAQIATRPCATECRHDENVEEEKLCSRVDVGGLQHVVPPVCGGRRQNTPNRYGPVLLFSPAFALEESRNSSMGRARRRKSAVGMATVSQLGEIVRAQPV